jgi:hypothetical protein
LPGKLAVPSSDSVGRERIWARQVGRTNRYGGSIDHGKPDCRYGSRLKDGRFDRH